MALPPRNAGPAVAWAGLACGTLDITQAFVAWGFMGVTPIQILQSVASGALGPASFQLGWRSAILGLTFHFLIAFTAAAVFWIASRFLPLLTTHALISGLIYGELVYLFMNFVVVPLSALHRFPIYSKAHLATGPIGHPILVGLPIALIVRHFSVPSPAINS